MYIKPRLGNSLILSAVILLLAQSLYTSCANQGMPVGGPKDTLAPVLLESNPRFGSRNFSGSEVRLTFNEFIISDAVSEELVVSPPLSKRPTIRTRQRSLIVGFNEPLRADATYSLDFKNSVVDNNERNPYLNLRMTFSTGDLLDTLRVAGSVKDGFNLEPAEKYLVMLHSNLHDSAFSSLTPDYIARTDEKGMYLFDNVREGSYRLYALEDINSNLRYDAGAERMAFSDSVIIPSAVYEAAPDTLVSGSDSILISGTTTFLPGPIYLRSFIESVQEQFIDKAVRENRYRNQIIFNEPNAEIPVIRLPGSEYSDWYMLEHNKTRDSLVLWVTDTLIAASDTLKIEIDYLPLGPETGWTTDTLLMVFSEPDRPESRRRGRDDEESVPEIVQFTFSDNIKSGGHDLNVPIILTAPQPVREFDFSAFKLFEAEDLNETPLPVRLVEDSTLWRSWRLDFPWKPFTQYVLEIDSAAAVSVYDISSRSFSKKFTTQKEDFYGRIVLDLSSVQEPLILQLLDNTKEEKVLRTLFSRADGRYIFDYLSPAKYKVKVVYDSNDNGQWDSGSFSNGTQPERVAYLPEITRVRSNWDNVFQWDMSFDPTLPKELIDKEEEEARRKRELEEKQRQEEMEREPVQMDLGGRSLGVPGRR